MALAVAGLVLLVRAAAATAFTGSVHLQLQTAVGYPEPIGTLMVIESDAAVLLALVAHRAAGLAAIAVGRGGTARHRARRSGRNPHESWTLRLPRAGLGPIAAAAAGGHRRVARHSLVA